MVRNIALFDLLYRNTDRHAGNLLVGKATGTLHPIDHGCVLAEACAPPPEDDYAWQWWPSARQPIGEDAALFLASTSARINEAVKIMKHFRLGVDALAVYKSTVLELATAVVELGGAAATCAQLAEECLARCFMARSAIGK